MRKSYVSSLLVLATLAIASQVQAAFIFDRSVTSVQNGGDDVNPVNVTIPSFNLFGVATTAIRVGSNGAFGITGGLNGAQYDNNQNPWYATGAGKRIIAPLWDDLNTAPNGGVTSGIWGGASVRGGTTYSNVISFTAPNVYTYGTGHSFNREIGYQVSLVTADTTVGTYHFKAGDIAFSYTDANTLVAFAGGQAAVGVTDGVNKVVGMPNTTNGILTSANRATLPTGNNFILFRWDATNSTYTAKISDITVPEPTSLSLLAVGAAGLLLRRRKAAR